MKKILFLLLIGLTACSKEIGNSMRGVRDPAFDSQVASFEAAKGSPINPIISIQFGNTKDGLNGYCTAWDNGDRAIIINPTVWEALNSNYQTILIWHELGHCDLNRLHDDRILSNGHFESIMNLQLFWIEESEWLYYTNEMFGGINHAI